MAGGRGRGLASKALAEVFTPEPPSIWNEEGFFAPGEEFKDNPLDDPNYPEWAKPRDKALRDYITSTYHWGMKDWAPHKDREAQGTPESIMEGRWKRRSSSYRNKVENDMRLSYIRTQPELWAQYQAAPSDYVRSLILKSIGTTDQYTYGPGQVSSNPLTRRGSTGNPFKRPRWRAEQERKQFIMDYRNMGGDMKDLLEGGYLDETPRPVREKGGTIYGTPIRDRPGGWTLLDKLRFMEQGEMDFPTPDVTPDYPRRKYVPPGTHTKYSEPAGQNLAPVVSGGNLPLANLPTSPTNTLGRQPTSSRAPIRSLGPRQRPNMRRPLSDIFDGSGSPTQRRQGW